jgi:hypothetical protein
MSTSAPSVAGPDHRLRAVGFAIAAFAPLLVAAAFVPFRDDVDSVNIVLVYVIVVVLASACGWASGVAAALMSTLSFDFFLTQPYNSLTIERSSDIVTAILLVVIGLIVVALVSIGRRSLRATMETRAEMTRMRRVAAMIAADGDAEDVVLSVEAELLGLLSLRDCRFETPPYDAPLPRVERTGAIEGGRRRWIAGELTLPADGAEIEVVGRGRPFGRLVLVGDWDVGVSIEQCAVAVTLADQLGAALAGGSGTAPTNEWNLS